MADDNVIDWGGITKLPSDPYRTIKHACQAELTSVIIIGYDKDGGEFFASSVADGGVALWLIERAKLKLLRVPETHFGHEQ